MSWWTLKVTQNEFYFLYGLLVFIGPSKRVHASYLTNDILDISHPFFAW